MAKNRFSFFKSSTVLVAATLAAGALLLSACKIEIPAGIKIDDKPIGAVVIEVSTSGTVTTTAPYTPTAVIAPTVAPAPTATVAPASATPAPVACPLPVQTDKLPSWLASHIGGSEDQWKQVTDQNTGLKLCAWQFVSKPRDLGVGAVTILGYGSVDNAAEMTGTVSYGVKNASGTSWEAAYLVGPGDFTVDQTGSKKATAIDTATWVPTAPTTEQIAARTPHK